jgi:hypothetical protein
MGFKPGEAEHGRQLVANNESQFFTFLSCRLIPMMQINLRKLFSAHFSLSFILPELRPV